LGAAIGVAVAVCYNVNKGINDWCAEVICQKKKEKTICDNPVCEAACGGYIDIVAAATVGSVTAVLITMLMECAMGKFCVFRCHDLDAIACTILFMSSYRK
jgi:hypothetical protein